MSVAGLWNYLKYFRRVNMKKKFQVIFMAGIFLLMSAFTQKFAETAEFKAGIYSYYAWWKPGFRDYYEEYKTDPLLMIGPVLSLTFFDDFTLSAVAITNGLLPSDASFKYSSTGSSGPYSINAESQIARLDFDFALSYRINTIFKIFIGYKYMASSEDKDDNEDFKFKGLYTTKFNTIDKNEIYADGPGCGISISYPFTDNIAATVSTSIVYMKGWYRMNEYYLSSNQVYKKDPTNHNYYSIGNNTTLSLSLNIPQIDTAIVLGGRFQVLKNYTEAGDPQMSNDYYYGITLSAVYSF